MGKKLELKNRPRVGGWGRDCESVLLHAGWGEASMCTWGECICAVQGMGSMYMGVYIYVQECV